VYVLKVIFCTSPVYVCRISKYLHGSTARANVDLDLGFKPGRRARTTDCAEGVEMVSVARDFRAASAVRLKEKLAQLHFEGGNGVGELLVLG
jgi:hypothetical protein